MKFAGEHLWIGELGHFFVLLAFIAALLSTYSFYKASKQGIIDNSWFALGRTLFYIQTFCIVFIFSSLFYICSQHWYEYLYAYKHSSTELEYKYLLACIWEGQEGSFLLWTIWHAAIGVFLLRKYRIQKSQFTAPVLTVISLAQFFLLFMLVGIYIGEAKLGSNPFSLTRNEIAAPIFQQANYLSLILDGVGLNVLLRNYWMVIHPPILFLGFALTIVPFAFAYAGIQQKKYGEWIKPALPWTLGCAAILGTGIMMGGKWAYESLSFGGYWAWDPVENASLVPWLILIAGLHTMLIYKSTGHSLKAAYFFIFLSFGFILYSTFLTRTGVLGDTSVHAFTEAGKAINIMIGLLVAAFVLPSMFLLFRNSKYFPTVQKEEDINSREFWMFIGSLVFFLTAIFIIAKTSVPVYNKVFNQKIAPPADVEFSYNKVVVLISFLIGMLTAIGQYFRYKSTPKGEVIKKLALPFILSVAVLLGFIFLYPFTYYKQGLGFLIAIYFGAFATIFSVTSNVFYIFQANKAVILKAGGAISHAGFALMILGMLISSSNKKIISSSVVNGINLPAGIDPMTKQKDDPTENLTLIRDVPATLGDYKVTYVGDSLGHETGRKFYALQFQNKNKEENFRLQPDVYMMKDNNMSSNPDTRSYLTKDVFTYISYALNNESKQTDTASFTLKEMLPGDTAFYGNGFIILKSVQKEVPANKIISGSDMALMANLDVVTNEGKTYTASPVISVAGNTASYTDDTLYAQNLFLRFSGIAANNKLRIGVKEANEFIDFVTVKSYVFPYINLVWLGLIIMAMGTIISMAFRSGASKKAQVVMVVLAGIGLVYMFLFANA